MIDFGNNHQSGLDRFVKAQRNDYETALGEIRAGCKLTHWIWYIFPQLRGLGHSYYSRIYGIEGMEEAKEYLSHEILGERLREITEALLALEGRDAVEILGDIDAKKVRSCMTLFDAVSPEDIFSDVLEKYYSGSRCRLTQEMLSSI